MQGFIRNIRRMAMAVSAVCALTSCVYEDLPEEPTAQGANSFLNIALSVPLSDATGSDSRSNGGYQDGDTYENYIDIDYNNYRIYFFDEQNTLIEEFQPAGFTTVNGTNYREYEIFGLTPQKLVGHSSFKVMVLGNWTDYPAVTPGITTIDDICNSNIARFKCLTNFELNPEKGRLIPFYGIRRYENITFINGETTTLAEPITMLRAMAKVEVLLDVEQDAYFTDVTLQGHNARGYCAPQGVYSQNDYGQGLDWENDYLHRLHLVGGKNDAYAGNRQLPFRCVSRKEEGKKEMWVAYIPEYRNTTADGSAATDEAYIDLHLNIQQSSGKPFRIYFADYGTDGSTNTASLKRMDIERNNIYRFTVKMSDNKLVIFTRKWNFRQQPTIIL